MHSNNRCRHQGLRLPFLASEKIRFSPASLRLCFPHLCLSLFLAKQHTTNDIGSIPVKRTFIKPAIGYWHWLANSPYNHCLVQAYVNHRWTILDAVLDKQAYETLYVPQGVEWGIDWNGKDDVRLYTESVSGPSFWYTDIDVVLDKKVGNTELPKTLAAIGNMFVNRQMWKRTGFHATE